MIYDVEKICSDFNVTREIKDNLEHAEYPFAFVVDGKMAVYGDAEEYSSTIHIRNIWSLDPRNGFGTTFLNFLFTEKKISEVRGESTPEAALFWLKSGAKFANSIFLKFLEDDEFQELIPFCLYKQRK